MKKFKFNKISIVVLAIAFILGLGGIVAVRAYNYTTSVALGTAGNFAVLAGSGITDTTASTIIGDAGSNPTVSNGLPNTEVTGTNYTASNAAVIAAKVALATAYADVSTRVQSGADIATELASQNLSPGIYHAGTFAISGAGTLTLDGGGNPNSVFIFQADTTLVTGSASSVVLTNGAQACNVFWDVGTSATLLNTTFVGTIMAMASITDSGDSTVNGRLLADAESNGTGAVTLNNTHVTVPTCVPSLLLQKTIAGGGPDANTAWTLTATRAGGTTNLSGITGATGANSDLAFPAATFTAGTYTLAESGVTMTNYTPTYSCANVNNGVTTTTTSSSITLVAGDVATCIITNTYSAPITLNVIKHVVNNNSGVSTANAWTLAVTSSNSGSGTGSAVGSETGTIYTLQAGKAYSVTESGGPSGYLETDSADCTIASAVAGTSYTCTITNDDIAASSGGSGGSSQVYGCKDPTATNYNAFSQSNPALCIYNIVSPLIHVTKVPSPLALLAGPGIVTYTEQITNPGVTALSNIIITDDKCSPLNYVSGDANVDAKLDSTETWTYTCQANLTKTTTNTASVQGTVNGLIAKDSTIATVVVSTPGLPKTGFPPQEPWYMVILSDFLNLIK